MAFRPWASHGNPNPNRCKLTWEILQSKTSYQSLLLSASQARFKSTGQWLHSWESFKGSHSSQANAWGPSGDSPRARPSTVCSLVTQHLSSRSEILGTGPSTARRNKQTKENSLALPPCLHWLPFWQTMLPVLRDRRHLLAFVCLLYLECFSHSDSVPDSPFRCQHIPLILQKAFSTHKAGFPPLNCVHAITMAFQDWRCSGKL